VLPLARRQVCWAHRRRDFQAMIDRGGAARVVGWELLVVSDDLFHFWPKVRDGTWRREQIQRQVPAGRAELRAALERGLGCAKTAAACRERLAVEPALWTLAAVDGVEPTNNAAERALRHAVPWRKTSYGTDSPGGSRFVEAIRTVVATCRQQGRNVLEFVAARCEALRQKTTPPALVPLT
jgi:transposase